MISFLLAKSDDSTARATKQLQVYIMDGIDAGEHASRYIAKYDARAT
jgi:hypothetical protein